jgi:hypothetical protein
MRKLSSSEMFPLIFLYFVAELVEVLVKDNHLSKMRIRLGNLCEFVVRRCHSLLARCDLAFAVRIRNRIFFPLR